MKTKMTEIENLKHRLAMINDDLNVIRKFIYEQGLFEKFTEQSATSDECFTNLNNIEIACDLTTDESLIWEEFKNK